MYAITLLRQPATLGGSRLRWAAQRHLPVRLAPVAAGAKGTGLPVSGPAACFDAAMSAQLTAIQTTNQPVAVAGDARFRPTRRPPV